MVQSMTGYGSASISSENFKVSVEVKSLNSKFVEVNLKLPRTYLTHEVGVRNFLVSELKRGKINALIAVEVLNPDKSRLKINREIVRGYVNELKILKEELGLSAPIDLEYLLTLPDAISSDDTSEDPEEWKLIQQALSEASKSITESRIREGKALEEDLNLRCELIAISLEAVEALLPQRIESIRSRILSSLNEIADRVNIDGNRFEQELIYYIEKLDVNEEIVRLKKHIDYFEATLKEPESNGKKLNFISQEMGREINTIGSKANDAEIQFYVVKMKEELEKIKEQLMNII